MRSWRQFQDIGLCWVPGPSLNPCFVRAALPLLTSGAHCGPDTPEFNGSIAQDVAINTRLLGGPPDLTLLHWPCITATQTLRAYRALRDGARNRRESGEGHASPHPLPSTAGPAAACSSYL